MAGKTIAKLGGLAAERWGMFTTAQAHEIGITRKRLSELAASGGITRVGQGVYRMAGAPEPELEHLYIPWLALGGATLPPSPTGAPAVVVAGDGRGRGLAPFPRQELIPLRQLVRGQAVRYRGAHTAPRLVCDAGIAPDWRARATNVHAGAVKPKLLAVVMVGPDRGSSWRARCSLAKCLISHGLLVKVHWCPASSRFYRTFFHPLITPLFKGVPHLISAALT